MTKDSQSTSDFSDISELISILLYCDDIVLFAENEDDLQALLFITENWCKKWQLDVNLSKTNILHVRNKSKDQSRFFSSSIIDQLIIVIHTDIY